METIKLKANDRADILVFDSKVAKLSGTIRLMFETLNIDENTNSNAPIPLEVSYEVLTKVMEWATEHQDEPQPTNEEIKTKRDEVIQPFDQNFFDQMDLNLLYDLISASNYLDMPGLLYLATREIAYMIKGKSPEDIRAKFRIENDFSPVELQQIQKENEWCEEK
ncbi:unnamed protein product [Diamesa tonsa]